MVPPPEHLWCTCSHLASLPCLSLCQDSPPLHKRTTKQPCTLLNCPPFQRVLPWPSISSKYWNSNHLVLGILDEGHSTSPLASVHQMLWAHDCSGPVTPRGQFLSGPPWPLALKIFPCLLQRWSLSCGGGDAMSRLGLMTPLTTYSLHFGQAWVSALPTVHCTKKLPW